MKLLSLCPIIAIAMWTSVITIASRSAYGQVDTIRLKDHRLNTATLKQGLRQYLVYFQMPASKKTLRFWFWSRDTRMIEKDGEKVFATTQHWYGSDTAAYRDCYSLNKTSDFSPLYHAETVRGVTKGYNWGPTKITGADTTAKNAAKGFSLGFTQPNFNWNLDIETFEMLPLAAGKTFAINFYDAGLSPPEYILYKVSGSEVISLLNNDKTDCWKLTNEGKSPDGSTFTQTFWISKKGHEFLKEEDSFKGGYRYKIKMPGTSPDLSARF